MVDRNIDMDSPCSSIKFMEGIYDFIFMDPLQNLSVSECIKIAIIAALDDS